jgi:hypothetical protein
MRNHLIVAASLALAACSGEDVDSRPRTTAFITESVLAATCGKAECHSTFAAEEGYVLDTTHGVNTTLRYELANNGDDSELFNRLADPAGQPLANILNSKASDPTPMPYDAPMPEADVQLILEWLSLGAPGSCDPATAPFCYGERTDTLVTCGDDKQFVFTKPTGGCQL